MTGTLLNVVAVLVGTTIGSLLGDRLAHRVREIVLQGVGLVTLLIGMQMALQAQNLLIVLASVVLGGAIGEMLGIEARLDGVGAWLERRFGGHASESDDDVETAAARFIRGFVTASLVFCVGPIAILGAVQDGLLGDFRLLSVKSLLDGVTSVAFASALGRGVYFSALVVLVYQGGLSLLARALGAGIPDPSHNPAVLEMTAVGGLLILGIGLRLLEIKQVRVGNLLPAVALAPLLTVWFGPALARLMAGG